eukprot:9665720-Alexandrium_andersonii.AAC.1
MGGLIHAQVLADGVARLLVPTALVLLVLPGLLPRRGTAPPPGPVPLAVRLAARSLARVGQ